MADLITSTRAKQAINLAGFTSAEDDLIETLVTAVSVAIERWCRRSFGTATYDEHRFGCDDTRLLLHQYPVQSVSRVQTAPRPVLFVTNTGSANLARVAVTATGLSLTRTVSGSTTTDTSVTWSGNATLQAVVTAVNALGNGWAARVETAYALHPSADLPAPQGGLDALGREAGLLLFTEDLAEFLVDAEAGWLERQAGWPRGGHRYRVRYTAGYTTIPEDVQEACAQWVAALFWQTKDNPATYPEIPTAEVRFLLAAYRVYPLE